MKLIIMVTMSLWDEPHRGRHHYAMALSARHRVLWVNRRLRFGEPRISSTSLEKVSDNLFVLHTGRSVLSSRVDERLNFDNMLRLRYVKKVLKELGRPVVIWIYDYKANAFAKYFRHDAKIIYFCNDYFGDYAYRRYEAAIAANVDYIFATSPKLRDRLEVMNQKCHFLPHGVWLPRAGAPSSNNLKPKSVGYVGTLRSGVDIVYLRRILEETNLKLVLAGPIIECSAETAVQIRSLLARPGVDYRGDLGRAEAEKVISEIDLGLLPYAGRSSLAYGFAIKFFDYLAAGKPIVATPYFEWPTPYDEFVHVDDSSQEMGEMFDTVYRSWDEKRSARAIDLARQCTWEKRIEQVGKLVGVEL